MFGLDNNLRDISLNQVKKFDVIEYSTENIQNSLFVVFDISMDEKIPAMLLQLWKYEGGYDHAFVNSMEVDFGLNKRVKYFLPTKQKALVNEIISYRGDEEESISDKEKFFFDMKPKTSSQAHSETYNIPYEISCEGFENTLVIPSWTPLQKLPIKRIGVGTILEIWTVENISIVMKVVKI